MITITEGIKALKKAKNIIEDLIKARDFIKHKELLKGLLTDVISAQTVTLQLQEEHSTLIATIDDLEKEIVRLKDWSTERERYRLQEVAPEVFAYVLDESMGHGEPIHLLCCNCYDNGQKGRFQPFNESAVKKTYKCERCGGEIHIPTPRKPPKRVSPKGWT